MDPDALPASMGIYVFDREVLADALAGSEADFGKQIIPELIEHPPGVRLPDRATGRTSAPSASFYEANLDLCEPLPRFNFYDATAPIFTHARYLPGHQDHQEPDRALRHRRRLHHQRRADRAFARRASAAGSGGCHHPGLAGHGRTTTTRPPSGAAPLGAPPIGIGHGTVDRADHRGQERPDRRRRPDHPGRQAGRLRRSQLLHPRRDRDHPQERGDHERHGSDPGTYIPSMSSAVPSGSIRHDPPRNRRRLPLRRPHRLRRLRRRAQGPLRHRPRRRRRPGGARPVRRRARPTWTTSSSATCCRPPPTPPTSPATSASAPGLPIETPGAHREPALRLGLRGRHPGRAADPAGRVARSCWPAAPSR